MRIETSNVGLQSKNQAYSVHAKTEQLQVKTAQGLNVTATKTEINEQRYLAGWQDFADKNANSSLRAKAEKIAAQLNQSNQPSNISAKEEDDPLNKLPLDAKTGLLLLLLLVERLKDDPDLMKKLGLDDDSLKKMKNQLLQQDKLVTTQNPANTPSAPQPSVQYSSRETLYQNETAQFSAQGQVKTADGKTINFNLDLYMHREVLESSETRARLQAAMKDPLVINLDSSAAALSDQRFSFDLSANGQNDLIPKLLGNRGFLALDKDNDGVINNGTELFGAQTGNGFAELAQYDEDKNGWIDENDSVYKNLKVWLNAGTDLQKLVDLKTLNIGALYTGSAQTSFHLQDKMDSQSNLGVIQSTGVFLKENGEVGTIQHVDLSV